MGNIYYVYEWIRLDTNKPFYVGKGKDKRCYIKKRGNNKHFNNIVKAVKTKVNILKENLTEKEALDLEKQYIKEYKNKGIPLVNLTNGGEGVSGYKATEEANKINRARVNGFDIEDYKDEIINLYINKNMSTIEIGEIYNVSKRCINSVLKRNNIKIRTSGETLSLNEIGEKRYNSKFIVVKNINKEIVKVCSSRTDFGKWSKQIGLSQTIKGGTKALTTYKNTENNYKGLFFYDFNKEEFVKLNIDKNINKEVYISDFNNNMYNSVMVEIYDINNNLINIFNSNKECVEWLCNTDIVNNISTAENAIARCVKNKKPYKNTYYFKKYSKSEYNLINNSLKA